MTQKTQIQDPLIIGGQSFSNRFFLGTGKFRTQSEVRESIESSGCEIVTVALRRIDIDRHEENILEYIPKDTLIPRSR